MLCHTSNPSAGEFQELEIADWRTLGIAFQPATLQAWPAMALPVAQRGTRRRRHLPRSHRGCAGRRRTRGSWCPASAHRAATWRAHWRAGLRRDGSGLIISASPASPTQWTTAPQHERHGSDQRRPHTTDDGTRARLPWPAHRRTHCATWCWLWLTWARCASATSRWPAASSRRFMSIYACQ